MRVTRSPSRPTCCAPRPGRSAAVGAVAGDAPGRPDAGAHRPPLPAPARRHVTPPTPTRRCQASTKPTSSRPTGTTSIFSTGASLVILRSFPPEATAIAERVTIEGSPIAMFVDGGRALVLSQVYDTGDLGGDDRCTTIGPPLPVFAPVDPLSDLVPPLVPVCASPFVKLTLFDLTGDAARTARELYVEGYYVGARRHGDRVRAIVQRDWGVAPGIPEPWSFIMSPHTTGLRSRRDRARRPLGGRGDRRDRYQPTRRLVAGRARAHRRLAHRPPLRLRERARHGRRTRAAGHHRDRRARHARRRRAGPQHPPHGTRFADLRERRDPRARPPRMGRRAAR